MQEYELNITESNSDLYNRRHTRNICSDDYDPLSRTIITLCGKWYLHLFPISTDKSYWPAYYMSSAKEILAQAPVLDDGCSGQFMCILKKLNRKHWNIPNERQAAREVISNSFFSTMSFIAPSVKCNVNLRTLPPQHVLTTSES